MPHASFVVEIVHRLFITVPHLDQIVRQLSRLRVALAEKAFEVSAMPADGFAQLGQFFERLEDVLQLCAA